MDVALADRRLADVQAWWRLRHPPPSFARRLDIAYTTAIVAAIYGTLTYGAASSALTDVLSPERLEHFGPPAALVALVLVARWGAFHGPVVFTVPDVAFLLGAPLPRRGLTERRLRLALASGAAAGAVLAAVMLVGLHESRVEEAMMLVGAVAQIGVLGVTAAWAVERSARVERAVWLATWPAVGAAAALAAWAPPVPAVPALALLCLLTAAAAAEALHHCAHCSAERHQRRAEARHGAIAALSAYDLRSARRSLEAARPGHTPPGARQLRRLPLPAVAWRDAVSALRVPGRVIEALALSAASGAVATAETDRPLVVAAATVAGYLGAARMLWPLRAELDVPDRTRVLLPLRSGRVLREHLIVPATVTVVGAAAGAAATVITRHHSALLAVIAIATTVPLTLCAAISARRGGRVPQTVLLTALAADPTGGATAMAGWVGWWPSVAVVTTVAPLALAESGALAAATIWILAGTAALTRLAARDLQAHSSP